MIHSLCGMVGSIQGAVPYKLIGVIENLECSVLRRYSIYSYRTLTTRLTWLIHSWVFINPIHIAAWDAACLSSYLNGYSTSRYSERLQSIRSFSNTLARLVLAIGWLFHRQTLCLKIVKDARLKSPVLIIEHWSIGINTDDWLSHPSPFIPCHRCKSYYCHALSRESIEELARQNAKSRLECNVRPLVFKLIINEMTNTSDTKDSTLQ